MADAYLIETDGSAAGIAVMEQFGVRFYASAAQFYPLDGKSFVNFGAVQKAVRALKREDTVTGHRHCEVA